MSIKKGLLIAMLMLTLTGCYPIRNVEKDLVPPMASVEAESIRSLIDLRFPGFSYHDFDARTGEDPLVEIPDFKPGVSSYYTLIQEENEGPVHLLIFYRAEKMIIQYDVMCFTQDIQKLEWINVVGDAGKELLISFSSEGNTSSLFEIYSFKDAAEKIYTNTFSNWVYGNVDDEEQGYLYTVIESMTQEGIRLYTLEERDPQRDFDSIENVHLDLNYGAESMLLGQANKTQKGLFIDGSVGAHSGVTELVMRVEGKLKSVFQNKEGLNETTFKPYYAPAKDIDGDGIIEIPFLDPAIGDEDLAMYETSWINTWKEYTAQRTWVEKAYTVDSYGIGTMAVPADWIPYLGVETIYNADNTSTMALFYDDREMREKMLTFYFVPMENYDESQYKGSVIIEKTPLYVLFFIVEKNTQSQIMKLSDAEIIDAFTPEPWLNE